MITDQQKISLLFAITDYCTTDTLLMIEIEATDITIQQFRILIYKIEFTKITT